MVVMKGINITWKQHSKQAVQSWFWWEKLAELPLLLQKKTVTDLDEIQD